MDFKEVQKHNTKNDCWVVIHSNVYNLGEFLNDHPGGAKVILKVAGGDGTEAFERFHPPDMMNRFLDKKFHLGPIDPSTRNSTKQAKNKTIENLPPLSKILNTFDFESVARNVMTPDAWAYYSSAGDDEITLKENHEAFQRIWLKPRVMVNVRKVDTTCTFLGTESMLPFYVTATALGKLGHPEGETILTKACGTRGIIQMIPTLASCSIDELVGCKLPNQTQWFQLYVNPNRKLTRELIEKAENLGVTSICITVDAPQLGRREKDMRVKFEEDAPDVQEKSKSQVNRNQGAARAISTFIDPELCWDDMKFFKSIIKTKIVLKGIQCGEDAVLAAMHGVSAIIISNHGGRQLDTCRSGIEILVEVTEALEKAGLEGVMELYIDGGIRRGSDIFKALALGAKGVGIGRPFLYAMPYGQEGVEHCIVISNLCRIYCVMNLKWLWV
jgi:L-lactate dehydrogenase (cytochrome)